MTAAALTVLVVDDEAPARTELAFLLGQDERVARVCVAKDATEALRLLDAEPVDVVCLDIRMPGMDGRDLARVLRRFTDPPAVIFVTAYEDHALEAFELRATDYLLKPVGPERLTDALDRILAHHAPGSPREADGAPSTGEPSPAQPSADETIAVDVAGVTRFVRRTDVLFVEAHGDYARLVTRDGRYLVRIPLTTLEERWSGLGFARIHRRWLVAIDAVDEVRSEGGRIALVVAGNTLEVSRRHARELRERLVRNAQLRRRDG